MEKEKLERVSGIARHHEQMWIERDGEGRIKQVYDRDFQPIETRMLSRSFEIEARDDGFLYKGEFVPFADFRAYARKRSQGFQRRNYGHDLEKLL